MTEAASSEIRRNSPKFEKQFSEISSYFLKLGAFVTTSFLSEKTIIFVIKKTKPWFRLTSFLIRHMADPA